MPQGQPVTPATPAQAGCFIFIFFAVIVLACSTLMNSCGKSDRDTRSIEQRMGPNGGTSSGYSAGYALGRQMGLSGAGSPTDDALRSMSATHAPGDELQFRIGYRNGLLAGQQERAAK
jgi:hypothetical protein